MPNSLNAPAKARILIVDDHPATREGLAIRIAQTPNLVVCGEADDVADGLRLFDELKPDLTVVDISLKTGDGLDLIRRIKARDEQARILVWSLHSEDLYAERALRAGALGYITKEQATGRIVEAIGRVLDGKVHLSPVMTEKLLTRVTGRGATSLSQSPVDSLSDREIEVLRLIGRGIRTSDIARQLHLSVKTIETYRDRIRQKLNLPDGNGLLRYATQWILEKQ